ncbi:MULTISPECIES: iron-sulfur cluster assembly protein IscA [Moraxella]|uniref:Iron-binding protein IscA n=1 Tax=Moraxella nasicaprae TaxID=2904122 RepID=A0ABY6F321_9GAMM|nr:MULTISPECIES: iron-sulfur cluster assembly protein IscA [Moraxella]MDO4895122.1 iron-sulfur cluster assembly protein IscA [Moraxella sp.]UXZ04488.1 iron-sulfur cluster assembly protein IscA [Moraxella nasicaprae]
MISLTPRAAEHVKAFLENRGNGEGIRVGVRTAGCSGLAYVLEFVDEINDIDEKFVSHDVAVFVDPKSLVYLNGLQMDYVTEGLNSGFKFTNPNQTGECGCGESFTV